MLATLASYRVSYQQDIRYKHELVVFVGFFFTINNLVDKKKNFIKLFGFAVTTSVLNILCFKS